MNRNGYILYEGPSEIDGAPIVVIATGFAARSHNRKTGDMVQTFILRADVSPLAALEAGSDSAICGDCPHRSPASGGAGTCYVEVGHAPEGVWHAYRRSIDPNHTRSCARCAKLARAGRGIRAWRNVRPYAYPTNPITLGSGRGIRVGSYGDPAAVPPAVWFRLVARAASWTGYTHQWRNAPALRSLVRASVDSMAEAVTAQAMGWRTFRVRAAADDGPRMIREAVCPASAEAGKRAVCASCPIGCNGASTLNVVIRAHGATAARV